MKKRLSSYNPSNGELLGHVEVTPIEEIPERVAAARSALAHWKEISREERVAYIAKAGNCLAEKSRELGELLSKEMGKSLRSGIGEVQGCAYNAVHKAQLVAKELAIRTIKNDSVITEIKYDPFGVCAVITPWNYPMLMADWMIIPALVAGNTVVFKPSEETPLIAQAYVEVLNQALPQNVLQIIHGSDEQGKALVNADVNLITFTGSREAGKHIMASAASGLKRLIMELGGKDSLIVMADADINSAAQFAVANSFENAGQMCISTERVFVDERIAEAFESKVCQIASQYRIGPWNDPDAHIGPMINNRQREHVLGHIQDALNKGAQIVVGGEPHPEYYVQPTVLTSVTDDMLIAQEETFGPVVCITHFSKISAAIESANNTPYGLGAVVFGHQDAQVVADQLQAGMIGINKGCSGVGDTPWVGAKESGFGFHGSPDGHRQFAQVRVVSRIKD